MRLALDSGAVTWGEFTLKSGRSSPYFFNLGQLCSGDAALTLADLYANAVETLAQHTEQTTGTLFGPAYKGIPLVALTAAELARRDHKAGAQLRFAYARKEAKNHGEQGLIVGDLIGAVIILDDVLTAGTAITQAVAQLRALQAKVTGLVVAFDRLEAANATTRSEVSALSSVSKDLQLETICIATATDLQDELYALGDDQHATILSKHLTTYGAKPRNT